MSMGKAVEEKRVHQAAQVLGGKWGKYEVSVLIHLHGRPFAFSSRFSLQRFKVARSAALQMGLWEQEHFPLARCISKENPTSVFHISISAICVYRCASVVQK